MALRSSPAPAESAGTLVSGDVRRHNLSIVVRYLLENGPSSRSQIADGTGLTRGSVTALTAVLLDAAIVHEASPENARGKGRPLTLLNLAADHAAILALQLDADRVTGLLTTITGEPLLRIAEQHGRPMGHPEPILDVMASVLGRTLDACRDLGRRLADMTVVVFAPVGAEPPVVLADTDLGWGAVDVLGGLRRREPRVPEDVSLVSDAPVAAMAELVRLKDTLDLIYIKSNSGIGGAIILNGAVVEGAHRLAGAFGHMPIVPQGEPCGCGQRGCLVTVAGPDAVLHAAGLGPLLAARGLAVALDEFTDRVLAREPAALAAWDGAAGWIARALQILAMSFDPQAIVLGGFWARLADSVSEHFVGIRPVTWPDAAGEGTIVVAGRQDGDAALLGAIWSARDRLLLDPLRKLT
ncbi:ROK family protein [Paeniglutamicibacter sp. NPDC091659]|uniref:ROK family protein n=1 Tax=Paeniglutamicibacter sp. NPDC091659 TaxID=3364389 RepID=UPI00382EB673